MGDLSDEAYMCNSNATANETRKRRACAMPDLPHEWAFIQRLARATLLYHFKHALRHDNRPSRGQAWRIHAYACTGPTATIENIRHTATASYLRTNHITPTRGATGGARGPAQRTAA